MNDSKNYCMGCMKEIDENVTLCPHCQYDANAIQHNPCLPKKALIADRYIVGKVISMANDSITYIGLDTETQEPVLLHEFFPVKIVKRNDNECEVLVKLGCDAIYRNCLQSFIQLWKGIGAIKNQPALPKVKNILDFNGTVYAVCSYFESITLKSYFEEIRKPLAWSGALVAFKPVFNAISALHQSGIIHGSISPSSIHVGSDGRLHIVSFMIPQCRSQVEALRAPTISGFSPIEFYAADGVAEPSSDVYSAMAVVYYSITGIVPPKATDRATKDEMIIPSSVAATLNKKIISCFVKSLSVYSGGRYQSMDELIGALNLTAAAKTPTAAEPKVKTAVQADTSVPESKAEESSDTSESKKKEKKKSKGSKKGGASLFYLAFGTFLSVVIICMLLFSVLYATVLYKNYDIPLLNEAFSSWSFLPMNKSEEASVDTSITTSAYTKEENAYVTVPDFTVHTYDSINTNETFNKNFKFTFTFEWSDDVPKDGIISQNLTKGESVLSGSTVEIVVSKGPEQIELPDVIGKDYDQALQILEDSHFVVSVKYIKNDGSYKGLTVATMDKVAGLEFDKGTEITLTVYEQSEKEANETSESEEASAEEE